MKSKDTQKKREREMKVVQLMIKLYCQGYCSLPTFNHYAK